MTKENDRIILVVTECLDAPYLTVLDGEDVWAIDVDGFYEGTLENLKEEHSTLYFKFDQEDWAILFMEDVDEQGEVYLEWELDD